MWIVNVILDEKTVTALGYARDCRFVFVLH